MPKVRGLVPDNRSIDDMAERLGLTAAMRDRAREVFRKLEDAMAFPKGGKWRNRSALYAACLHAVCRAEGTPRTFKELASVTGDSAMGDSAVVVARSPLVKCSSPKGLGVIPHS